MIDLSGQKFTKLLVVRKAESRKNKTFWYCKCDCGNYKEVYANHLKDGLTKSCGCLHKEVVRKRPYEHIYNTIKKAAKETKREIELTYEEFLDFTKIKACYYCGDEIQWIEV